MAAIVGLIIAILILVHVYSTGWFQWTLDLLSSLGVPQVYAGDGLEAAANSTIDLKTKINGAVMVCIVIAFFWSLAVCLHSENENKVMSANDINKMLLGFLIGSGKAFLGL